MNPVLEPYARMADALDGLHVGLCLFDEQDRTLLWNRSFLRFFPEHEGRVFPGEPYAENLRRFYGQRLSAAELPEIERYVADGIARHRAQASPFVFEHATGWVRVNSSTLPGGWRLRVWSRIASPADDVVLRPAPEGEAQTASSRLMEDMANGVMVSSLDGIVTTVNDRLLALYRLRGRAEALGRSYEAMLVELWQRASAAPEEIAALDRARTRLAEDRRFAGAPFEVPLPGDRWVLVTESVAQDGAVFSTHIDITAMKRQARDLAEARDAAMRASEARASLMAIIGHEIRTPMNGIIGMTELLLDSPLTAEQRMEAETVHRSSLTLLDMLNELLDFSKLDAGRMVLEEIGFDLGSLLRDSMALMRPLAEEKGLALALRLGLTPGTVRGDPKRLRQVLLNLVSNAIKFTSRGAVELLVLPGAASGSLRFEVRDSGIGLEEGAEQRIFSRFEQADASIARRFGGSGLGLHISRELVELMGGSIGASRRPGGGSIFWVDMPLPSDGPAVAPELSPSAGSTLRGRGVLLVMRSPTNRLVVQAMLQRDGMVVRVAPDYAGALALAAASGPELVLADVAQADMPATEFVRQLRALRPEVPLPVIALHPGPTVDSAAGNLQAQGFDHALPRPLTFQAVRATMRRFLIRGEAD